jgi:nickel/cobalt transporter (NiCoT) family protein
MLSVLRNILNDSPRQVRSKIFNLYGFLITANIAVWMIAIIVFHKFPLLLGTAVLAYSLGLRHAVDADHIAAIDNVTRKLMQEGKKPISVGFFFSLGHSTIVVLMSIGIALGASFIQTHLPEMKAVGGVIGTSVSTFFLLAIAIMNLFVLWEVFETFQSVKRGENYNDQTLEEFLNQRGLMARFFRPLFRLITKSWQMYPLGILFGLGFDTATEVGLLGISAIQASQGLPILSIMIFPALFTAGMSLIDTTDGILMLGAYGWAYIKPIRKLYYNMSITFVSVLVALLVGGIQALGLFADKLSLKGGFWDFINYVSEDFGLIGYFIIGIFIFSWLISTTIYRLKKYDDIEVSIDD